MAPLSQQRLCQHLNDGPRVVQLAWTTDWEDANGVGLLRASCRNATFFRHAFYTVQGADHTTGFCAQGRSGGGAAIAYAPAQYKLSDYFDCVVIGAGRGVATGPALNLCPLLTTAPYAFTSGVKVDTGENTTTCAVKQPLQSDIDKWAADGLPTGMLQGRLPRRSGVAGQKRLQIATHTEMLSQYVPNHR